MDNSITNEIGSFFTGLFDSAASAASTYLDFDLQRKQLDLMQADRDAERLFLLQNNPNAAFNAGLGLNGVGGGIGGNSQVLTLAIIGVGAALLFRAFK